MPKRDGAHQASAPGASGEPLRDAASRTLMLAVWLGLIAGLAEVLLLTVKQRWMGKIVRVSRDVIWMAPLADIGICLMLALSLILLGVKWRKILNLRWSGTALSFVAYLTVLLHYWPLHVVAKLVLALGLAVQSGRLLARHPRAVGLLLRWSTASPRRRGRADVELDVDRRRFLAGAATVVGGLVVGTRGLQAVRERRLLASLSAPVKDAPNVLLVVLDTVRAQNLGLYGYERDTTPALDRLAHRGVVFEHAYATAPWTLPTHASLFTGHWHHEMSADWEVPLDDEYRTLAEFLSARGYVTAGFVANTAYGGYEHGLDRGFAHYEDYPVTPGQIVASSALGRSLGCSDPSQSGCRLRDVVGYYELLGRKPADAVRRRFLDWLDGQTGDRPFFAFLNLFDAHVPYLPPPPFASMFGDPGRRKNILHPDDADWTSAPEQVSAEQDAYDGAIAYVDHEVGLMLDGLAERGLSDDTLVIVTSDHGEEFLEHGVMTHGYSLYSQVLRVPLLMVYPGRMPEGMRVTEPVSVRDVPATVEQFVSGTGATFPGRSLTRTWLTEGARESESIFSQVTSRGFERSDYPIARGDMHSVIRGRYHYIREGDGTERLYDIVSDPEERFDVADATPAALDSLRPLLETIMRRTP